MKMFKKFATGAAIIAGLSMMVGTVAVPTTAQEMKEVATTNETNKPKYIFMFIGDGMSYAQTNAAQIYQGVMADKAAIEVERLGFDTFPSIGTMTTQDSTSFAPDSASTATSMASGVKTHSSVIGLESDKKTEVTTIAEQLQDEGYKVGVVSTVTLNHATPAAYYANTVSRNNYYDIALQMADSDFDYFGGGALTKAEGNDGKQKSAYDIMEEKGYMVTNDKEEILDLGPDSGKVYAISPELVGGAMPYDLDAGEDALRLKDFVAKGIDVLDNEDGFFMMVESGKIDWSGHANDAMSNIQDTIAFDEAVAEAVKFYNEHPDETLIIVTGDHETGGMTLGQATTGYNTAFDLLANQTMSYEAFDEVLKTFLEANPNASFEQAFKLVTENFGLKQTGVEDDLLVLNDYELNKLKAAYEETLKPDDEKTKDIESKILYGGYEPFTVTLTHILNNKAGIGWTSYSHTAVPVPVYAIGAGAEAFEGSYDNTDIYKKTAEVTGLK